MLRLLGSAEFLLACSTNNRRKRGGKKAKCAHPLPRRRPGPLMTALTPFSARMFVPCFGLAVRGPLLRSFANLWGWMKSFHFCSFGILSRFKKQNKSNLAERDYGGDPNAQATEFLPLSFSKTYVFTRRMTVDGRGWCVWAKQKDQSPFSSAKKGRQNSSFRDRNPQAEIHKFWKHSSNSLNTPTLPHKQ